MAEFARAPSSADRRLRSEVEQVDARVGQLVERGDAVTGLELAAERPQIRDERIADRLCPTLCDGPPVDMAGDTEHEPEAGGERVVEADARVRGEAGEQRGAPSGRKALADSFRGPGAGEGEARHRERMARRHQRCENAVGDRSPPS